MSSVYSGGIAMSFSWRCRLRAFLGWVILILIFLAWYLVVSGRTQW